MAEEITAEFLDEYFREHYGRQYTGQFPQAALVCLSYFLRDMISRTCVEEAAAVTQRDIEAVVRTVPELAFIRSAVFAGPHH
jgi:hypothetical protein